MSAERVPLGFGSLSIPAGSHVAYTYYTEAERISVLSAFVSTGLRNHEKCITLVPEYSPEFWIHNLSAAGIDVDNLPPGQLLFITYAQLLPEGIPYPVASGEQALFELIDSAADEGWRGARVCSSCYIFTQTQSHAAEYLRVEAKDNDLLANRRAIFLCSMWKDRIPERLLNALLSCHPLITDGKILEKNATYRSPDELDKSFSEIVHRLQSEGAFQSPFIRLGFLGDIPVLRVGDELDICSSPQLGEFADWVININHRRLVIDLSDTTFMDAASISMLIQIMQVLKAKGGRLAILDPRDPPRKVFQLVRLAEIIPIFHLPQEAAQAVQE